MKPVKPAEYRGMSDEQLALTLKDVVKNLFHLRFQSATDRLETPSELRKAKQEIARIKTIQRERQLAAQKAQPAGAPQGGTTR
jgi:large subunit ribosomal protein L29